MKVIVTAEKLNDRDFRVTVEDETAITTEVTTKPQRVITEALGKLGIKGKRGRAKGSTLKRRGVDLDALSLPVAPELPNNF
jgi:hypothetical protein